MKEQNTIVQQLYLSKLKMKQCYYELLDIDKKATNAEIKTNYRKLALKYHPDKNSSEQGKQMFLLITQAYQVLSDPNERTWYDNNRQKILFNKDDMSKEDLEMYTFGFNIWEYFVITCFKGFDDTQTGFYAVYRNVFEKLKAEEVKAFTNRQDKQQQQQPRKYSGFGDSTTVREKVLKFYDDWQNFTTYKTFIWVDEWDTRDAQNRYIKRQMQKQNKKQRQKQKKNYIKTIKDLVSFLKKRDPRYREYVMEEKKKEQERQLAKKQKEEQKKRQKQEMKKVKQQLQEERFKQIQEYYKKQQQNIETNKKNQAQSSDGGQYGFSCAICQKEFKSDNQLKNHENSKMHKKNVKALQQQVMSKAQMLQEISKQEPQPEYESSKAKKNKKKNKNNKNDEVIQQKEQQQKQPVKKEQVKKEEKKQEKPKEQKKQAKPNKLREQDEQQKVNKTNKKNAKKNKKKNDESSQQQVPKKEEKEVKKQPEPKKQEKQPQSDSDDDPDAFMNAILKKAKPKRQVQVPKVEQKKVEQKKQQSKKLASQSQQESENEQRKKGKAKLKKEKKMMNKKQESGTKCNVCSQDFSSKTKLFEHINKTGHAKAK